MKEKIMKIGKDEWRERDEKENIKVKRWNG